MFFFKVAIIAGNFELAEFIKNHKDADIGKLDYCTFPDVSLIFFMITRSFP